MKKLSPSVKLRKEVSEFIERLQDVDSAEDVLTQLVQLSTQLITQEGLEAHQRDHLGVDRYERGEGRRGYRSGYEPGYLDTAEGRLEVAIPQVRGSDESYRCTLYDVLRGDSEMVQRLATEMYARGLSTRDIEDAFTDEQGRCLLSRSKVSEVTEVLWEQYEAFQNRDLSDLPLLCLFLDGLYEPLRTHGITREAILCAWGITLDGRKVLISLSLGNKESGEAWLEFLRDLDRRGFAHTSVHHHRRCRRTHSGRRSDVVQEPARSLLGAPDAELRQQGSQVPMARDQTVSADDPRRPGSGGRTEGRARVSGQVQQRVPGPVQMPHRGPGRASGPTPAPLAAQEVHPHHQSDRTQLRRGETQDQNTAPFLHREELPQTRLRCPDPSCGKVASHQHHLHRISSAQNALRRTRTRSPIELGGGRLTLRRSRSRRGILQDSQDLTVSERERVCLGVNKHGSFCRTHPAVGVLARLARDTPLAD